MTEDEVTARDEAEAAGRKDAEAELVALGADGLCCMEDDCCCSFDDFAARCGENPKKNMEDGICVPARQVDAPSGSEWDFLMVPMKETK